MTGGVPARRDRRAGRAGAADGAGEASAGSAAVDVQGVRVRYGEVLALDGVGLTLRAGRVCGLVGVNGSGKSTLLKAIVGRVRPAEGTVRIHGTTPPRARRTGRIAYVPQSEEVDWDFPLSVAEVVMTGRYGRLGWTRSPRREDRDAVAEALERVGLADLARRQVGALSGGQRKRAFVARALAQQASVMLLDEPFAGVDKRSEATIVELLREAAGQGRTVLVSTHDLHALPELCDEAVLLHRRVLVHGTPAEVLRPESLALAFGGGLPVATPGASTPDAAGAERAGAGAPVAGGITVDPAAAAGEDVR